MGTTVPLAYNYIRFSTAEQRKGDSLSRQADRAKLYADEKGLVLDDSLTILDLGKSAFKGANAESGNLAAFLEAVDMGRVPEGSYLLIESLDRLSRDFVFDALQLFIRIINKGITIVSLKDKIEFSKESLQRDMTQLIICIVFMSRANEESETKSIRISSAWKNKREAARATGKVLTKVTPFWIRAKDDRSGHYLDEKGAAMVRRLFQMARDGIGVHTITNILNSEGKTSPKGTFWTHSAVAKVLRNRAVIGEATFSSFKNPDGTRQPVEPIPDYYPPVIDKALFYEVQDNVAVRKHAQGGAKSDNRNLFRGLLTCGYCGSKMQVISNVFGTKKKRQSVYVQCTGQRLNLTGCKSSKADYYNFQYNFFKFIKELDMSSVYLDSGSQGKEEELKARIADNRFKLDDANKRLNRILTLIETTDDPSPTLMNRIKEIENDLVALSVNQRMLNDEWEAFDIGRKAATSSKESLLSLMEKLNDPVTGNPHDYWEYDDAQIQLRTITAQRILNLVNNINLTVDGILLDGMTKPNGVNGFSVTFKNGLTRMVNPDSGWTMKLDFRKPEKK